jgi:5-methylcytosine-specific restriction endonuclease McrA
MCNRLAFGAERNGRRINPPVDHIVPHQGQDDPMFWDEENLRTLCHACHNIRHSKE